MKNPNIKKMAITALMTAVIAVLSQIAFPLPSGVPVTLQTFAIALCGYVLGAKPAATSVLVYILMGCAGIPVFANFKAGIGIVFGVTGGFLWGFIIFAVMCGIAFEQKNKINAALLSLAGLILCHAAGVVQFSLVTHNSLWQSALIASIPYLIKDIASAAAAYIVGRAVKKSLRKSFAN